MTAYVIRSGCSFRTADGELRTGGQAIELDDDVARVHADKIDPAPPADLVQAPAPAESAPARKPGKGA